MNKALCGGTFSMEINWKDELKENNLRVTNKRLGILNIISGSDKPLTAAEIYDELKKEYENIRLSTIYRNLNLLSENKILSSFELSLEQKEKYYEIKSSKKHHHHLVCVNCEKITPLKCPHKYIKEIEEESNYLLLNHHIKLYGLCDSCKN